MQGRKGLGKLMAQLPPQAAYPHHLPSVTCTRHPLGTTKSHTMSMTSLHHTGHGLCALATVVATRN